MTNDTVTPDLSIIIKIEKLLAQGDDPGCSPEEREAFQDKAAQLIARHRIDRSLIGGHLAADDKIETRKLGKFDGVYGRVRIELMSAVAHNFDCQIFWSGYGNKRELKGYGFKSDLDLVEMLGNRLLADADLRVQAVQAPSHYSMYNESGDMYTSEKGAQMAARLHERRGFYMGYAQAVDMRLRRTRQEAETQARSEGVNTESAALVLVDRKRQVNDQFRAQVKTRAAGGISGAGWGGHQAGHRAGSEVSLAHGNAVGGGQKALGR